MGLAFKYAHQSDSEDDACANVAADQASERNHHLAVLVAQHEALIDSMYREELLDPCTFSQLQELQDADTPHFLEEIITCYMDDFGSCVEELDMLLHSADPVVCRYLSPVDGYGGQILKSNSCIGAQQVTRMCAKFRDSVRREDKQGCLDALERVKEEFRILRPKLLNMLELEREIVAAGGILYYMNRN